jgi:pimeloyl-ACP methyl ester carboxylesterase
VSLAPLRRRRVSAAWLALVLLAGLAACTGKDSGPKAQANQPAPGPSTSGPLSQYYTQSLRWAGCGDRFECTTLRVPLDYAKPVSGDIRLAVIRLPATDRKRRLGSLLVNPGGPGGSGVEYAREATSITRKPLRDRFDIVGFDPRGVAQSSPVKCLDDKQLDTFLAIDGSPDAPSEEQALDRETTLFTAQCKARSGRLLPHVSTADAARDIDVLRGVLGDRQLYYLGKSYGTFLGGTYAELFPKNVGRLVLDGALDPRTTSSDSAKAQAAGFSLALRAFVADCVKRAGCPLGTSAGVAIGEIDNLLAVTDRQPLPTSEGRELTQALATLGVAAAMYDSTFGWPALRDALRLALSGNGTGLLRLSDFYTERGPDGHYANNQNEVIYAVNCIDRPDVRSVAEIEAELPSFEQVSPQFGAYLAWGSLPCVHWPVPPVAKPHTIKAAGAKPILVVGTTRDPATPYAWAQGLAEQLESGVLLTYEGDGHTAYARTSSCIDNAVNGYLLRGRAPADGTRCR